jgi:hypothetical protein
MGSIDMIINRREERVNILNVFVNQIDIEEALIQYIRNETMFKIDENTDIHFHFRNVDHDSRGFEPECEIILKNNIE